jgi:hypothetical protein
LGSSRVICCARTRCAMKKNNAINQDTFFILFSMHSQDMSKAIFSQAVLLPGQKTMAVPAAIY